VRKFTAHGAQLAVVAVRPLTSAFTGNNPAVAYRPVPLSNEAPPSSHTTVTTEPDTSQATSSTLFNTTAASLSEGSVQQKPSQPVPNAQQDSDARSDTSFDPLFDDEEDADGDVDDALQLVSDLPSRGGPNTNLAMPSTSQVPNFQPSQYPQATQRSLAPPKNAPPLLDPPTYATFSSDMLITASIDGQVILWDKRVHGSGIKGGVGRLWMSDKTPPWCLSVSAFLQEVIIHYIHSIRQACWSADGGQIYAGRRNGTVDVWDVRQLGVSGLASTPRLLKTLRNPLSSGVVSCVVAFPDGKHIAW
jgi:transcriptional activator SPT8